MQNDDLEFINCKNVLTAIESELSSPSRADVAKHLGLSRTATSAIATKLINAQLVTELASVARGRGRPGIPLALNSTHWHALGAAFYSGSWTFVIINLLGTIVESMTVSVEETDPESVISALITGLRTMAEETTLALLPSYGIGAPGLIDHATGSIFRADDLGWSTIIPLQEVLEAELGKPALIMNRYRANGLAEIHFGSHSGKHNIIYLGIGTGIAGSLHLDQELMNSTKYRLGHIVIDPHGPLCGCGQHGCLQAMASEQALVRYVRERKAEEPSFLAALHDDNYTAAMIATLAEEGDSDAQAALKEIAEPIAIAISTFANAIAPDEVIIGGPLGDASSFLVDEVRTQVYDRLLDWQREYLTVVKGSQGHFGPAVGAAALVLRQKMELIFGTACSER